MCVKLFIVTICLFIAIPAINCNNLWAWNCDSSSQLCNRLSKSNIQPNVIYYPTVESCRLVCGKFGSLWPRPTNFTKLGTDFIRFSPSTISLAISAKGEALTILRENELYFYNIITAQNPICIEPNNVHIQITVKTENVQIDWTTDESYELNIDLMQNQITVNIIAETVYGARHGLESLIQLIEFYPEDQQRCLIILTAAKIIDKPIYPHRGVLVDSTRNFQSVEVIQKHLDAMAASKLNVLHWHISDSQSFPLELPSLPNMTKYGAYSEQQIYSPNDIQALKNYARTRGIKILTEIDAPAHAGNGWQWGPDSGLGNLAVCINKQPWRSYCIQPPCGQLNPANPNLYTVLGTLYRDIQNMFPEMSVFHMGGDEVFLACWNSSQEIIDYLDGNRTSEAFHSLWAEFQAKAVDAFDRALGNGVQLPIILWTSGLTDIEKIQNYLPKERYVIQTWVPASDPLPQQLVELGYRVIISTKDAWYLDHGFWGTTKYHDWRTIYNNQILAQSLGGEVCMWGEYVDSQSVLSRLWPRGAAAAERLWANPSMMTDQAEQRFYRHRERLVSRGIPADMMTPKWCYQNEGQCK